MRGAFNGDRDVARNWLKAGPRQRLVRPHQMVGPSNEFAAFHQVRLLSTSCWHLCELRAIALIGRCRERDICERPACLEEDVLDSIAVIRRNILRLRSSGSRSLILRQVSAQGPGLGASHRHTAVRRRTRDRAPVPAVSPHDWLALRRPIPQVVESPRWIE